VEGEKANKKKEGKKDEQDQEEENAPGKLTSKIILFTQKTYYFI
jgi:hypothetical protein